MVLAVDMGQGPDWTALIPLIQAKQQEAAERVQADAAQTRVETPPRQAVAATAKSGGSRLDQRVSQEQAPPRSKEQQPQREATAQITLQAHIAFKAQVADENRPGLRESTASKPSDAKSDQRGPSDLTAEEERVVRELQARDAEVRRHEQAHASVGGTYASAPSYVFQVGPDGRRYAVGGSVEIDMSPVPNDPEATIAKMEVVRRAAMAPAETSSADRSVAAAAQAAQAQALAELNAKRAEKLGSALDLRA